MRSRRLAPLLLLLSCQTRLCHDPTVWTPVEYVAPMVAEAPMIDGKLDDPAWRDAPWSAEFRLSNRNDAPRQKTRAKLAWDASTLYVAFDVRDDEILTPYTRDDEPLYQSEVVELFVDADRDGATYDEIELSPRDVLFDANFRARRQGMNLPWASGARHAVQVDGTVNDPADQDRGWSAELALPLASLSAVPRLPPAPGDRWRMNLFRLDHGRGGVQGQAFSPVMVNDFHNLPKFGTLIFGTPAR
jgi:hypothetical protein